MPTVTDKPRTFAARLRELREESGLTQRDVAAAVGVAHQTYLRWEQGKTEPSVSQLQALASVFGKTPNDFLDGTST